MFRDILSDFPLLEDRLFHPENKEAINSFFAGEMKVSQLLRKKTFLLCTSGNPASLEGCCGDLRRGEGGEQKGDRGGGEGGVQEGRPGHPDEHAAPHHHLDGVDAQARDIFSCCDTRGLPPVELGF